MGKLKSALSRSFFLACAIAVCTAMAAAQGTSGGEVTLFQGPNATGASQELPLGTFQVNGKNLGGASFSVRAAKGYRVRFCEEPITKTDPPKCEEYGEGTNNLKSMNFTSIRIWQEEIPAAAPTREPPVIVFEGVNWSGRSQIFLPGMYRADRAEFGHINDNMAMSAIISKGFRVRFCDEEGVKARGGPDCEVHDEGRHNLRFANSISFLEVIDLSDKRPDDETQPVVLYEDPNQGGKRQGFDIGTFTASSNQFDKIGNDKAMSVTVKAGYRALVCPDEIQGDAGKEKCEEFGSGKNNLRQKRSASYLKVWKNDN